MQNQRDRSRSNSNYSQNSQKSNGNTFVKPSKRLFIGGVLSEMQQSDIRNLFQKVGTVVDFFVKINEGKGFGFVEFGDQEEADEAIKNLNGKKLSGKMLYVKYATERPKGERKGNNGNFNNQKEGFKPREGQQQREFKPYNNNRNEGSSYQKGNFNAKGTQNAYKGKSNNYVNGEDRYSKNEQKSEYDNKATTSKPKEQSRVEEFDY